MTRALFEAGIRPDLLIGTSAGAINAAYLSGHTGVGAVDGLADLWRSLRRQDIFPVRPIDGFLGFFGKRNYLCSPTRLRNLLRSVLGDGDVSDTAIPLRVVAADLGSGREIVLSEGSLIDAVLASASLPGIFPPVPWGERLLIDGGVINNAPLSHAVRAGADDVYLMVCGHACAAPKPPTSAIGIVLQSVSVLIGRQLVMDVEHYESRCRLHVVPQLCPLDVLPMNFSQADRLIKQGYEVTAAWLKSGHATDGQASVIEPHQHH